MSDAPNGRERKTRFRKQRAERPESEAAIGVRRRRRGAGGPGPEGSDGSRPDARVTDGGRGGPERPRRGDGPPGEGGRPAIGRKVPEGASLPPGFEGSTLGERRALSYVGGAVDVAAHDEGLGEALQGALAVRADEAVIRDHVHGFHSYPARLHPQTASRLIHGLSQAGATVLDPFCGSGTVLVEARLAGRRGLGVDANPLAVELARAKARGLDGRARVQLMAAAERVAAHADERRKGRAGPTRQYPDEDRELFDVHVLLELDGLADGIGQHVRGDGARILRLVLSSLLTKLSRKAGDSSDRAVAKRIAGGYPAKLFRKKVAELVERCEAYAGRLPERDLEPDARVGDARRLDPVEDASIDLVVSSPPYPGVYDYHSHHAARLRWLGLDDKAFEKREIGTRRRLNGLPFAVALGEWERDLGATLGALRRVLRPGAMAALVIADSVVSGRAVYAEDLVARLAKDQDLELLGRASQERPHFHKPTQRAFARRPRREHVLVVGRS